MESAASETDGGRLPSTTVAAKQYSRMEVHGHGQAQLVTGSTSTGSTYTTTVAPVDAPKPAIVPSKPINTLPWRRDPKFIGREDVLSSMDQSLKEVGCVARTGAGGVGKTQTAVEYCWWFKDTNPDFHIFWTHAGSTVNFDVAYRKLARRLGLTRHAANVDNDEIRADVRDWLNENEKWLMVIDNADQYDDFFATEENDVQDSIQTALPWTRPCTAMIIYTSRHDRIGAQLTDHPCLRLDVMSPSDGLAMFRSRSRGLPDDCEVLDLLEAVDFLPLSIAHATAYLDLTKVSIAAYVRYVEVSDEKLLDMLGQDIGIFRRDSKAPKIIAKTWLKSFELLRRLSVRTANLFCLTACLERQNISSTLIYLFCNWQSQGSNFSSAQTRIDLELPTTEAEASVKIAELESLALISHGHESNQFSMHRHVRAATLRHLSETGRLLAFLEQLAQFIMNLRDPESVFASEFTNTQLLPVAANLCLLLSACHRHTCSNLDPGCELLENLSLQSISLQLNFAE